MTAQVAHPMEKFQRKIASLVEKKVLKPNDSLWKLALLYGDEWGFWKKELQDFGFIITARRLNTGLERDRGSYIIILTFQLLLLICPAGPRYKPSSLLKEKRCINTVVRIHHRLQLCFYTWSWVRQGSEHDSERGWPVAGGNQHAI